MSIENTFRRVRLTGLMVCVAPLAIHATPAPALFADFQLPLGQVQVLELPAAISTVRVLESGVATAIVEGARLTLRATDEGRTQVELLLAGESTVRVLGLSVQRQPAIQGDRSAQIAISAPTKAELRQVVRTASTRPPAQSRDDRTASLANVQRTAQKTLKLSAVDLPTPVAQVSASAQPEQMAPETEKPSSSATSVQSTSLLSPPAKVVASAGSAQGGESLTAGELLKAVRAGLAIHPEVRAAEAERQRAETELGISRAGYLPTVEVSAGPETGAGGAVGYNVMVSQMLYDWGKVASSVDAASAGVRQKAYEALVLRERVAMEIVDTALDVMAARQRLKAVEDHRKQVEELVERTDVRARGGYSDASERSRAMLTLMRADEQIDIERGRLREAAMQYRVLVGEPAGNFTEFSDEAGLDDPRRFARLADAITHSPAYRKAVEEVKVAQARIRNASASLLPEVRLEGEAMRREIGGRITNNSMIALRLRMTPFQGGSNVLRVDAERQRLATAEWTRDNYERETQRKFSALAENVSVLRARAKGLVTQRMQSLALRSLYEDQFQAAFREVNDLLIIETELLESERQRVKAHSDRLRAQFQAATLVGLLLDALEGRLEASLAAIVAR